MMMIIIILNLFGKCFHLLKVSVGGVEVMVWASSLMVILFL